MATRQSTVATKIKNGKLDKPKWFINNPSKNGMKAAPMDPNEMALDRPLTWICSSRISTPMIDNNGKIGPINRPQPNNAAPNMVKYRAE